MKEPRKYFVELVFHGVRETDIKLRAGFADFSDWVSNADDIIFLLNKYKNRSIQQLVVWSSIPKGSWPNSPKLCVGQIIVNMYKSEQTKKTIASANSISGIIRSSKFDFTMEHAKINQLKEMAKVQEVYKKLYD